MTVAALVYDDGPTWSPDGTRIAFARATLDGSGSIVDENVYTVDASGGDLRFVASRSVEPRWLPDGRITVRDPFTSAISIVDPASGRQTSLLPVFNASS